MADFYKLEKDVAAMKAAIEDSQGRLEELERRRRRNGRTGSEKDTMRLMVSSCLDSMEAKGMADFSGMSTNDATMRVITFAELSGCPIDFSRGNRSIIGRVICKRYGFDNVHGKLVRRDDDQL